MPGVLSAKSPLPPVACLLDPTCFTYAGYYFFARFAAGVDAICAGSGCADSFCCLLLCTQATSLAHSLLLVSTSPVINVGVALLMRHAISAGEVAGALLALGGALTSAVFACLASGNITSIQYIFCLPSTAAPECLHTCLPVSAMQSMSWSVLSDNGCSWRAASCARLQQRLHLAGNERPVLTTCYDVVASCERRAWLEHQKQQQTLVFTVADKLSKRIVCERAVLCAAQAAVCWLLVLYQARRRLLRCGVTWQHSQQQCSSWSTGR
jgi:hypothetical protein